MMTYITISEGRVSGMYHDDVHGSRRLLMPDPDHVPAQIEQVQDDGTVVLVNDPADRAPLIDGGPNPDTRIPVDALEITHAQYTELALNQGLRYVSVVGGVVVVEVVEPPTPAMHIPEQVSMRQARLALLGAGLLAQVNAAVAAMPGTEGDAARIEWEYAQDVRRDSPLVQGLGSVLGLDDARLDALFVAAAAIV